MKVAVMSRPRQQIRYRITAGKRNVPRVPENNKSPTEGTSSPMPTPPPGAPALRICPTVASIRGKIFIDYGMGVITANDPIYSIGTGPQCAMLCRRAQGPRWAGDLLGTCSSPGRRRRRLPRQCPGRPWQPNEKWFYCIQ